MRKLLLMSLLLALLLSTASAFAITVVVNDQTLPASPPALERSNRVLLPLRVVFESLGADVSWEGTAQTITAIRADKTVVMTINRTTAYINDRAVTLDVPPQLIGSNTYVPVRFPAEAFGADVRWLAATRTVAISLSDAIEPPPGPPYPPSQAGQVTGVISSISNNRIGVRVDSELKIYRITRATVILSRDRQANPGDLLPGDEAIVEYNEAGDAISVQATYDTVEGMVVGKTANEIEIDTRSRSFRLLPNTVITTEDGGAADYADIRNGDQVVLRITPDTYKTYGIMIRGQATGDSLLSITSDLSGTLTSGEIYRLSVTGPTGGQARFSLGDWQREIPMTEDNYQSGVYRATFTVPELTAPRDEPLIVTLRTRDGRLLTVRSRTLLHFAPSSQTGGDIPLRLTSPIYDDQVGDRLAIEGYTAPFAEVTLTITWRGPNGGWQSGQLTSTRVTANARGHFVTDPISLEVNTSIDPEDIRYRLTAVARDQQGHNPTTLEVEFTQ